MTTQAEIENAYSYLEHNQSKNDFYRSLFQQFRIKGSLSEKQILAIMNGMTRDQSQAKSEVNPVTEVGMYRDADGGVFRVKSSKSGNLYANRFTPEGATKSERFTYERGGMYRLSASMRMTVEECAELGVLHSICCICGAELTDPSSIERGIGPVCASRV